MCSSDLDRFDGKKRNPFNEAECGNHYARAMAAWSMVLAYSGFNYSAVTGKFSVTSRPGKYFWSNGYSWGTIEVTQGAKSIDASLKVNFGNLKIKEVGLKGLGSSVLKAEIILPAGSTRVFSGFVGVPGK